MRLVSRATTVAGITLLTLGTTARQGSPARGVPEMEREQTAADIPPDYITFPPDTDVTADDARLIGVDSGGNSWFVAQHEPGSDICLVLAPVDAWVVGCSTGTTMTVSNGSLTGIYDLDGTDSRNGERVSEHLTVTGL